MARNKMGKSNPPIALSLFTSQGKLESCEVKERATLFVLGRSFLKISAYWDKP